MSSADRLAKLDTIRLAASYPQELEIKGGQGLVIKLPKMSESTGKTHSMNPCLALTPADISKLLFRSNAEDKSHG